VENAKPYTEIFSRSELGGHFVEMMTGFYRLADCPAAPWGTPSPTSAAGV